MAVVGVLLPACSLDRAGLAPLRSDGAVPVDAAGDSGVCVPRGAEICNGIDDNCNGSIDEGFDTRNDPANCGMCGRVCTSGPRGVARCELSECELECEPGWADCNAFAGDGCEADLTAATSCGACGAACAGATPLCGPSSVGGVECVASCAGGTMLCGASCVDTTMSTSHCGGCGVGCAARPNTLTSCAASACSYACVDGFGDCDRNELNGCEADLRTLAACGACGTPCMRANATTSCATGTCTTVSCSGGFDDCDGDVSNGCERSITTATDCGTCDRACPVPANATAACMVSTCALGMCNPGFSDCNDMAADGCEINTASDPSNCGGCARICPASSGCVMGTCVTTPRVVDVAAGDGFSCLLYSDGRVMCWGSNSVGQLGNGSTTSSSTPVAVSGISTATAISAGGEHACAILTGGTVRCWGGNGRGQLGDGSTTDRSSAVAAGAITDAAALSAGDEHTCVVRTGGTVSCWGRNNRDQLGTTGGDRGTSMAVPGVSGATAISCGEIHSCALLTGGAVFCWGDGSSGQLGRSVAGGRDWNALAVPGVTDAVALSAGGMFTCAVRTGGGVLCWGENGSGQLGNDSTTDSTMPVTAMGASGIVGIDAGTDHVCARTMAGRVTCWGLNGAGQLGDGTTTQRRVVGALLPTPADVLRVSAGAGQTCVARMGSGPQCWGLGGSGQLGNGGTSDSTSPVNVMLP